MKKYLILTSAAKHLGETLLRQGYGGQGFELIFPGKNKESQRFFPDGEIYASLPEVDNLKGKRVVVLHSGAPKPNDGLAELELILQILQDHKIRPEVFFSYFPYCRQDKVFKSGETNAAESLVKKLINYYKVRKIYTIDAHFWKMAWVKKYPIINISAVSSLMEKSKEGFGPEILFLSPDKGGKRRTGITGLKKKRINSFRVEFSASKASLKGKAVGVVDDILATGGTLLRFYDYAKKSGAKEIIALITHGPLESGIKRIKSKFPRLYLANTIDRKDANVDVTNLIINAIKKA